jgi:hypothetical protein
MLRDLKFAGPRCSSIRATAGDEFKAARIALLNTRNEASATDAGTAQNGPSKRFLMIDGHYRQNLSETSFLIV